LQVSFTLCVHGGAGEWGAERHAAARAGCERAAAAGVAVLAGGGTALDAVEVAVRLLEDDPEFNAGRGSALTRDGTVEVDAAIMTGELSVGAVAAVPGVLHPVTLARRVLEANEHVMLVGTGALAFAREHGIGPEPEGALVTPRAQAWLAEWRRARASASASGGTVGAVARDAAGRVAAATSTGGRTGKRPGRVGDCPIIGAGTFADGRGGACSATGHGEAILRVALAHDVVARLEAGVPADEAAQASIARFRERTSGDAGVIVVDREGRAGIAHHSENMAFAVARAGAAIESGIRVA
jgi:beta-aspartyl-peptidase (threonine type)